jgi:SgrR family transcriptional regulator
MQLAMKFAELKKALLRGRPDLRKDVPVTVEEIARHLYCTERNAKMLIRKMSDQGWIVWTPGRGRGHRSLIRFVASAEELLLQEAKACVEQGNLNGAMGLLQTEGLDPGVTERFIAWLGDFFGYKETDADGEEADTLRLPMRAPVHTLDPAELLFSRDLHIAKQVFDTLVRYDPERGRIEPHVAHSWESDEQGQVWTFYLRKGVKFHHGRELTAADVAYSLLRLRQSAQTSTNGWLAEDIRAVRPIGRLAVQVELRAPNWMFPHYVSSYPAAIVPEEVYADAEASAGGDDNGRARADVRRMPVGTGPFRVTRHDEGALTLEAFPDYFRERAHLDRVELLYVPDPLRNRHRQALTFHIGKAHHVQQPVPAHWQTLRVMTLGSSLLAFNLRKAGPQQDVRLRRAIHLALHRERMIAELGMDNAMPARGFFPPPPGTPQDPLDDDRIELARQLVAASDYRGETLRLLSLVGHRPQSDWVQARCAAIGVRMDIEELSHAEAASLERLMEGDAKVSGVVADDDEARCLIEMYKMSRLSIRAYAPDELRRTFDETIADIVAEPDAAVRLERIRGMERLLTDGYRVLFLAHTTQQTVFSPDVRGISVNTLGWFDFKDIWFRPQAKRSAPPQ